MSSNKPPEPAMELTIQKSSLLKELASAQGLVDRKVTIPILTTFLFEAGHGELVITATDLDSTLRTSCSAQVKTPGSCTIPARKFYDYVRLLGNDELRIKLLENHWVHIRSGSSNTRMVGMPCDNFPKTPVFPQETAIQLQAALMRTMISKTIIAISQEESRYTLNGALLILKPEGMTMVATDGHRMAHIESTKIRVPVEAETKVLIPRKAVMELGSLLNVPDLETFQFAKDETTLFFSIGSRLLTARQLTGQFPNYQAVLPRNLDKTISVRSDEFARAIQRVSTFSDIHSNAVRLNLEQNQVRLASSSSESGQSEDIVETCFSYQGEPFQIGFNSRYMLDFMKVTDEELVKFSFQAPETAAEFHADEGDSAYKFRYIIMPMRV